VFLQNITSNSVFEFTALPKISITPPTLSIKRGEPLRIYCETNPPLPVNWTKVNDSISSNAITDGGVLILNEATVEDTGKYRCQASNDLGTSEAFAMVTVFGKYLLVFVTVKIREAWAVKIHLGMCSHPIGSNMGCFAVRTH